MDARRRFRVVYKDGRYEFVRAIRYEIRDGFVLFHSSEARFDDMMSPLLAISAGDVRSVAIENE